MNSENEKIVMIPIGDIMPHPKNAEIYGEVEVDDDFIESIRNFGVLTPLTVTPAWGEAFRIISGERRWLGARHAGLSELPCMIRDYEGEEMETLHLIACNKNREKNMGQRVNEFLRYKQLLCHFPELSNNSSISTDEKLKLEALGRFLPQLNLSGEKPLRARDIIEQQTGFSEYWQKMSTIIFDDEYLDDKLEILKKAGAKKEVIDAMFDEWVAVRQLALAEKVSPNEAASSLKNLFADTLAKLQKKQKKAEPKNAPPNPSPEEETEQGYEHTIVSKWLDHKFQNGIVYPLDRNGVANLLLKFYIEVVEN